MKLIKVFLLLMFGFIAFLSCEIASPYVEAVVLKIDTDETPADETPSDDDPADDPPASGPVAMVSNFQAEALSYDPDADSGIIRLTWDAPVATGDQTEATRVIVRSYEAADPPSETSGTAVHDALPSETQADFTGVALAESPHFGIWTMDADDRVSDAQYVNRSIVKSTVNVMFDCYIDSYMVDVDHTSATFRVAGDPAASGAYIAFLRFYTLPVTSSEILAADLNLRLAADSTSVPSVTLSRVDDLWTGDTNYFTLASFSTQFIGLFPKGSLAGFTPWDVTSTMQNWSDDSNYGFQISEQSGGEYNSMYYHSRESSNDPFLELYHGN